MFIDPTQIFYKTKTYDPATKLPLYVLDTTELPNPKSCDFTSLVEYLVAQIPDTNYSLICFTAGISDDDEQKFSWVWGVRAFSLINAKKRKLLRKLYIVHESWWVRAVTEVLKSLISSKFLNPNSGKVLHISNLSELSRHVDITKINISLANYSYEFSKLMDSGLDYRQQKIVVPIHVPKIFGKAIVRSNGLTWYYYNLVFWKINQMYYKRLLSANSATTKKSNTLPMVLFHNNSESLLLKSNILQDCISRNQLIDLQQFDIFTLLNIWKFFLKNLAGTSLIPMDVLVSNKTMFENSSNLLSLSSTDSLLKKILSENKYNMILNDIMNYFIITMILNDVASLGQSANVDSYLLKLSKFLARFFCGIVSNYGEPEKSLGHKFIYSMITHWPKLSANKMQKGSVGSDMTREAYLVTKNLTVSNENETVQSLVQFCRETSLFQHNLTFLKNSDALIRTLNSQDNLNNFNLVAKAHTKVFELNSAEESKENDKPSLNAFKSSIQSYLKPLKEINKLNPKDLIQNGLKKDDLSQSFSSLKVRNAPPVPPRRNPSAESDKSNSDNEAEQQIRPRKQSVPPPVPPSRVSTLDLSSQESLQSGPEDYCSSSNTTFSKKSSVSSLNSNMSVSQKKPKIVRKLPSNEFIYADKRRYHGIENGKVIKLAQLFEERYESYEIISSMRKEQTAE